MKLLIIIIIITILVILIILMIITLKNTLIKNHIFLPSGVPVKIMSPGLRVNPSERLSIIAGILKIILLVLLSCFFSLFKNSLILKSLGSKSVKIKKQK